METELLFGTGLLAALLGTIIFNGSNDDDNDTPPQPETSSQDGTEGADFITGYDAEQDNDGILMTLGGDDLIDLRGDNSYGTPEGDIDSGEGEDTISLNSSFLRHIDGGQGDDIIDVISADSSTLVGGDGNDSITVDTHEGGDHSRASILGGTGDDLIHVDRIIATEWEGQFASGPIISGGEGADRFELSVEQDGNFWDFDIGTGEPLDITEPPDYDIATITDFTSGEDQLAIDATTFSTSGEFLGHEIIQSDDGESTGVKLQYTELNSIIWLDGTESITEDDLEVSEAEGTPLPDLTEDDDLIDSEAGFNHALGGSDELRTLGGNDTISLEEAPIGSINLIDLGVGNDRIDGGAEYDGILIQGSINGGAGNDEIIMRGNNVYVDGGEGADTLTFSDGESSNNSVRLDGGAGDDLLTVTYSDTDAAPTSDTAFSRELIGGAGNDTFAIAAVHDSIQWADDPSIIPEGIGFIETANILDFTSGEDQLLIDATSYSESDQYLGHALVPQDDGSTMLVLRFVHAENPGAEARSFIRLAEGTTITDDDLVINSSGQTAA